MGACRRLALRHALPSPFFSAMSLQLQQKVARLRQLVVEERGEVLRAERGPPAARHAADLAAAAMRAVREEDQTVADHLREAEAAQAAAEGAAADAAAAQLAAAKAGAKLQAQAWSRERAADEVQKDIELAQVEAEKLLAERVALDLEVGRGRGRGQGRVVGHAGPGLLHQWGQRSLLAA